MSNYKTTTDREVIKDWVVKHGGLPAMIGEGKDATVRVDFPGREDERDLSKMRKSKEVSFDEFFKIFDKKKLAFVYYPKDHIDEEALSYRFIKRENVDELEAEGTTATNFSNPDAVQTLPGHSVDERMNEADQFGFDKEQDNETLQKGPSPEAMSEQAAGGSMPDPASDDDTTRNARDFDLVLEDDPQAQEKD